MAQSSSRCYCSVPCCSNNKQKFPYLSFHDFPVDAELRAQWVWAIKRDEGPSFKILRGSTYVCSQHFSPEDKYKTPAGRTRIQKGAVPTRFIWNDWGKGKGSQTRESVYQRANKKFIAAVLDNSKEMPFPGNMTEEALLVRAVANDHDYTCHPSPGPVEVKEESEELSLDVKRMMDVKEESEELCVDEKHLNQESFSFPDTENKLSQGGDKKSVICPHCGKGFAHKGHLNAHITVHTEERPFTCLDCGKSFKHKDYLKEHMLIHGKAISCLLCGKQISNKKSLRKHNLLHTGVRPFSCDKCGKTFVSGFQLKRHQPVHLKEKPFSCSSCGKGFSRLDCLKEHQKLHNGVKEHVCSVCGSCFPKVYYLKQHQRVHTGEKPYKCVQCGKCFAHRASLASHERVHTGEKPYQCTLCGKSFSQSGGQQTHMKKHCSVMKNCIKLVTVE